MNQTVQIRKILETADELIKTPASPDEDSVVMSIIELRKLLELLNQLKR